MAPQYRSRRARLAALTAQLRAEGQSWAQIAQRIQDQEHISHLDTVERTFEEAYQGRYESMEAYVEQYLEDGDAHSFEQFVPEWLRPYVKIDTEMLARDWEMELHVVEAMDGGVLVFETRY